VDSWGATYSERSPLRGAFFPDKVDEMKVIILALFAK